MGKTIKISIFCWLLFGFWFGAIAQGQLTFQVINMLVKRQDGQEVVLNVQLAADRPSRRHGLMFRKTIKPHDGMLFRFDEPRMVRMWMKNTYIPLDMVFFDEKRTIVRIAHNTVPHSLDGIMSGQPVLYVLELPAGDADRYRLKAGDSFSSKDLK